MKLRVDFGKESREYDVNVEYKYESGGNSYYDVCTMQFNRNYPLISSSKQLSDALNRLAKDLQSYDAG